VDAWVRVAVLSVGGALGVNARYWLGVWISRWAGQQFPWATFTINVSGSFAIGFLTVALTRWVPHPNARLLVVVGFLGGYTTFSTYTFDSLTLWERGEVGLSLANALGSLGAGLVAVALGVGTARALAVPAPGRAGLGARARVESTPLRPTGNAEAGPATAGEGGSP
jgi:CrcB protein